MSSATHQKTNTNVRKVQNTLCPIRSGAWFQVDAPKKLLNHLDSNEHDPLVTAEHNPQLQEILQHSIWH